MFKRLSTSAVIFVAVAGAAASATVPPGFMVPSLEDGKHHMFMYEAPDGKARHVLFHASCGPGAQPKYSVSAKFFVMTSGSFHYDQKTAYYVYVFKLGTNNPYHRAGSARLEVNGEFVSQTKATGTYYLHIKACNKTHFVATQRH